MSQPVGTKRGPYKKRTKPTLRRRTGPYVKRFPDDLRDFIVRAIELGGQAPLEGKEFELRTVRARWGLPGHRAYKRWFRCDRSRGGKRIRWVLQPGLEAEARRYAEELRRVPSGVR